MRYFEKVGGDKCYLSPINPDDAEQYTKWLNDLEVSINTTLASQMVSLLGEKEFLKDMSQEQHFAIIERETEQLIGTCGFVTVNQLHQNAELGILIGNKDYWGQGYGTEAINLLVDYGFNILNLHNIKLNVYSFNQRAIKCYKKCGFKEIGRRREARVVAGEKYDVVYMDLLASEFEGKIGGLIQQGNQ